MDSPGTAPNRPYRVGFLLLPGYSFVAFAAALEPLRMANQLRQQPLYEWRALTPDGGPVAASNGLQVAPEGALTEAGLECDLLLVCGGVDVQEACARDTLAALRRLARRRLALGSVCTGAYLLAEAGVMEGYRCTLHWEHISSLYESLRFPETVFTTESLSEEAVVICSFRVSTSSFNVSGSNVSISLWSSPR